MKKPKPLSREFLLNRGFCCNNGCTNCPYNMAELHNTIMGKKLIEHTLPEIARQLERIADSLEKPKYSESMLSSLDSLAKHYTSDEELGKEIRKLCQ